ncbi:chloramphenicol acetyltransferase [Mangrovivirga cuniculi]|uniref:Chloramphenicol acetyltransferase n=1 Tax=Mangrovivirga cuniculi TaxID=2715131 RepID=A0A4D7JIJ5_9BACT|nr:chloramphenicol acetyltransferase [Mangrovivirga cuniculi]QCK15431.1 chloramphenicol acetyltransferase [Mangrovivirga cuniculi]
MSKRSELDISTWNRREHFNFFNSFEEPYFGFTTDIDCTGSYNLCKSKDWSFSLYYMHCILKVANSIDAFKLRILDNRVYKYEVLSLSSTVLRDDKTFGFTSLKYYPDFEDFFINAQKEMNVVKKSSGLDTERAGPEAIHFSSIPWIKFSSISHARSFKYKDSCPKLSVGKLTNENGKYTIPVSAHANHALVDGYDVGKFFTKLEKLLNNEA